MAQIQKLEAEYEVKSSADKYFDVMKNHVTTYPKVYPQVFKNVQILEGDGISQGSVKSWTYILDGTPATAKDRTTLLDNKNRSLIWSIFGGDLMNYFNTFDIKLVSVTPKGEGSCLAKWVIEFEKKNEDVPNPTSYLKVHENLCRIIGSN